MNIDETDVLELAAHIVGLPENSKDSDIEDALIDKLYVDLYGLSLTVEALLPMIDIGSSELTGKSYKGFSVPLQKNSDQKKFLIKTEI